MVLVLLYLGYRFFVEYRENEYSIEPKQGTSQTQPEFDRELPDSANTQIILERDIFNTSQAAQYQQTNPQEIVKPLQPVIRKPLELRLLGTVAGDGEIGCAIIENLKTKVQDLYKTGDAVNGARIERIERNRIILLNEGVEEVLNLYVAGQDSPEPVVSAAETPVTNPENITDEDIVKITSQTDRQVNKNAFLAKIGGIEAILKTVKLSTHKTNGVEDGLQINGLEGSSMAKFVGLKNGDVVQTINGQTVTNDRKAFQVLRKARALSSFSLELKRGTETKKLSFNID